MKKLNMILLTATTTFMMSGCLDGGNSDAGAKKTYSKTAEEVYQQSCKKCHGENAEGLTKKKAPALNDKQAGELELDLYEVKNGGTNQSSGTEHDVMEHNMQKLLDKGYDYDPKAMAEYLEKNFYKDMDKLKAAPAKEETK